MDLLELSLKKIITFVNESKGKLKKSSEPN